MKYSLKTKLFTVTTKEIPVEDLLQLNKEQLTYALKLLREAKKRIENQTNHYVCIAISHAMLSIPNSYGVKRVVYSLESTIDNWLGLSACTVYVLCKQLYADSEKAQIQQARVTLINALLRAVKLAQKGEL